MKRSVAAFFSLFISLTAYCQTNSGSSPFNFDFETIENGKPAGWFNFESANYILALDSTVTKSGKYAASIEFKKGDPGFTAWAFVIPENYAGKEITLSGYIKTENVSAGYAGLWMRIDPEIAFDNMEKKGVTGTTDWTKYELTLAMDPERTEQIVIGGLLAGKGKMWIDRLSVSVDGKELKDLKPIERKQFPAEKDREFDNGSGITGLVATGNQLAALNHLGLIWGFLKYYHPKVASGEYNWDYELFRILPEVLSAEDSQDRDRMLVKWITSFGEFSPGKETPVKSSQVKMEPDLDWINHSGFSPELRELLLKVKHADRPKEQYYIGLQAGVGNPDFKNENPYASMKYPDAGFRLLALYRYWNIIQYYFPYKYLIGEDWKNVLPELIPRFLEAKDETEYTLAVLELIGRINDSHAQVWGGNDILNAYFGNRYAAAGLSFVENKPVVTTFHNPQLGQESGLQIGDVITAINNRSVEEIVKERLIYSPASNYPTKLRDIATDLLRTNDTILTVEFIRADKKESTMLKTFPPNEVDIYSEYHAIDSCFKMIGKDIAYINNGSIKREYLPEIWKEAAHTKGLIIDIRNYPSDFIIYDLSSYLLPRITSFAKFTNGSIQSPGLFTFTESEKAGKKNKKYYKGKVVILVNELSQSSAEFHAMAYRVHPNAKVIGSTTAGADGNVSFFYLPGEIRTAISGIGVYYPDGKETQRIGIVPDIEVKPTIQGIKKGQDELIEKAIKLINGQ